MNVPDIYVSREAGAAKLGWDSRVWDAAVAGGFFPPASDGRWCWSEIAQRMWPSRARPVLAVRPTAGSVYFVRSGKRIKIGFSTDVERRFRTLRTICPHGIEVLVVIAGTKSDERALHRKFRRTRLNGEWFKPTPGLLKLIERHQAEAPL